ncbi:hypothetical protein NLJ89_g11344 [Agrocybe chaxingu]|uniref:Uncharacterized protein n=1 Tax=Agrocybe chaxingu TaxID=84603 RepID=A0A9W8JSK2_9AGAR|nr:hypothetical protein NLJ89_g11344 [Agrocybe chaxingu]
MKKRHHHDDDHYPAATGLRETLERCECFKRKSSIMRNLEDSDLLESLSRCLSKAGDPKATISARAEALVTINLILNHLRVVKEKLLLDILEKSLSIIANVSVDSRISLSELFLNIPLRDVRWLITAVAGRLSPQILAATATLVFSSRSRSQEPLIQMSSFIFMAAISEIPSRKSQGLTLLVASICRSLDSFSIRDSSMCRPLSGLPDSFLLYGICNALSAWLEEKQMLRVIIEHHSPILETMIAWFQYILGLQESSHDRRVLDGKLPTACTPEWLCEMMPVLLEYLRSDGRGRDENGNDPAGNFCDNLNADDLQTGTGTSASSSFKSSSDVEHPDADDESTLTRKIEGLCLLADLFDGYPPRYFANFFEDLSGLFRLNLKSRYSALRDIGATALLLLSVLGMMIYDDQSLNHPTRLRIKQSLGELQGVISGLKGRMFRLSDQAFMELEFDHVLRVLKRREKPTMEIKYISTFVHLLPA